MDNFLVPDYKSCHVTQLCLSPFIELPLPDNNLIEAINADCDKVEEDITDEPDSIDTITTIATPAIAKTVPLVLTTTLKNDVKVRNMLADLRAAPIKIRPVKKLSKTPVSFFFTF